MPDRRAVLSGLAGLGGSLVAGCLAAADRSTPTASCAAVEPPQPTGAADEPASYPAGPPERSADAVERFVASFERAFRYNDALGASPDLIGRTNEVTVEIDSASAQRRNGGFAVEVTGVRESDFLDPTPMAETPGTPTRTPLPAGHGPFETTYIVTDRRLEREGVTVECW